MIYDDLLEEKPRRIDKKKLALKLITWGYKVMLDSAPLWILTNTTMILMIVIFLAAKNNLDTSRIYHATKLFIYWFIYVTVGYIFYVLEEWGGKGECSGVMIRKKP